MGTLKAFINSSFLEINKFLLQVWLLTNTTTPTKKNNMTKCSLELGLLRVYVLSLPFPLFSFSFFRRVWTVTILFMHMDSLCKRQSAPFTGPTTTLSGKNIIKNGSHSTIHPFKNYFALVFFSFQFLAK